MAHKQLIMGAWVQHHAHKWTLRHISGNVHARVTTTKNGWVWAILDRQGGIIAQSAKTFKRSRRARRQAQKALAWYWNFVTPSTPIIV